MNTQQGPTTSHKKPFSASHDKLCGKEYEKIYVCVYTESLYYTQKLTQHWKSITLP